MKKVEDLLETAGEYLYQVFDYASAIRTYQEIIDIAGNRYEGWWGLVRSYTEDFERTSCGPELFKLVSECKDRAIYLAEGETKRRLEAEWQEYLQIIEHDEAA